MPITQLLLQLYKTGWLITTTQEPHIPATPCKNTLEAVLKAWYESTKHTDWMRKLYSFWILGMTTRLLSQSPQFDYLFHHWCQLVGFWITYFQDTTESCHSCNGGFLHNQLGSMFSTITAMGCRENFSVGGRWRLCRQRLQPNVPSATVFHYKSNQTPGSDQLTTVADYTSDHH